jgi:IrrE N-terminal-like domain
MSTRQWRPAELTLLELGITEPREIDVRAIAEYLGASVRVRHLDSCEARIVGIGDRAIISVSHKSIPRRRRFSAAHELGHWRHHRGRSFSCRSSDIGNPGHDPLSPERQADEYAADLLLPWYLFHPIVGRSREVSVGMIKDMADLFDTSLKATAIRIAEANVEPLIVASYGVNGRNWARRSKDVPERWYPAKTIDPDTYAYDVWRGAKESSHMSTVGADAWFEGWNSSQYEMKEQSMRIGPDEILVLLRITDERMQVDFAPRFRRR